LRENWAILANKKPKKRKSPQYVVEIKVVGQYLRKNWAILGNKKAKKRKSPKFGVLKKEFGQYLRKKVSIFAICSSGKIFLTPKMVHCPKFSI
jgi:abortive infection bacteriophage resistance protein